MANYLQKQTDKEIIGWNGTCIVHEDFSPISILDIREQFQDVVILAHSECPPDVLDRVDLVGGTSDMVRYVEDNPDKKRFMLVTECGLGERLAIEFPDREFVGTCALCPYMKSIRLGDILDCLKSPKTYHTIQIDQFIIERANRAISYILN